MSREEAWAALAAAHTGILTTLRADGMPIALPVWFVAFEERIYVGAPSHTKKLIRIRNDPRVSFLIESGERWVDLVGVHVTGHARIVEDPALLEKVRARIDEKYAQYRSDRSAMPDATANYYDVPMATIEIVPDARVLNWDNSRLGMDSS
jgi:nitroimidazol reductase NimA-like FMN-containing flavoprotein (pyridoxamine 5'-phosphate oxidase superfamily)